jgi:hypothetical protein
MQRDATELKACAGGLSDNPRAAGGAPHGQDSSSLRIAQQVGAAVITAVSANKNGEPTDVVLAVVTKNGRRAILPIN